MSQVVRKPGQLLADELCVATGSNTKNGQFMAISTDPAKGHSQTYPFGKLCVVADGYGDTAVGTARAD